MLFDCLQTQHKHHSMTNHTAVQYIAVMYVTMRYISWYM